MSVAMIPIIIGTLGTFHKHLIRGLEEAEIGEVHPNYDIVKISQNT